MGGAELSGALGEMWRAVLLFVPKALIFIAILLVGYGIARLIRAIVARGLHRVGVDRAVERGGLGRVLRRGDGVASGLCARLAFYVVMLFALQLAFGIWGPNAVSALLALLIAWLPRAFVAIVIVVVAVAIGHAARDLIQGALGGLSYGSLLARAASAITIGLGVIAALDQVRIATAVTQPVLIAVLATVAGVTIVGVGGGLVRPMQRRWEVLLARAGQEAQVIRHHARSYAHSRTPTPDSAGVPPSTTSTPDPEQSAAAATGQTRVVDLATEQTRVIRPMPAEAPAVSDPTQVIIRSPDETQVITLGGDETQIIGPEAAGR